VLKTFTLPTLLLNSDFGEKQKNKVDQHIREFTNEADCGWTVILHRGVMMDYDLQIWLINEKY
jgi:hypothetical protein